MEKKIIEILKEYKLIANFVNKVENTSLISYEYKIENVKSINKVLKLENDISFKLGIEKLKITTNNENQTFIFEIPKKNKKALNLSDTFSLKQDNKNGIIVPLGEDKKGNIKNIDITKQPHLLIAGATGSGKSVCLNSIIVSIMKNYNENNVKLILIDLKKVELSIYKTEKHLLTEIITEKDKAINILNNLCVEMDLRYKRLEKLGVRNIEEYNLKSDKKIPYIVVIIDELAELMLVGKKEIEYAITRLSQLARACGIHLILATQRPSTNIITGVIKANIPSRIALKTTNMVDSRVILDSKGAEKLNGKGDMLYLSSNSDIPIRLQSFYIDTDNINDFLRGNNNE